MNKNFYKLTSLVVTLTMLLASLTFQPRISASAAPVPGSAPFIPPDQATQSSLARGQSPITDLNGAGPIPQDVVVEGPFVSEPVTPHVANVDLRTLPIAAPWKAGDPMREVPRRVYPRPDGKLPPSAHPSRDPLLALQENVLQRATDRAFSTPDLNFEGVSYTGVQPPDTVGDVGPNHYIQMVNSAGGTSVQIFDKSGGTLAGPFELDSLWTAGGDCATGLGDPIVLYDQLANRWLLSEFAGQGNHLCVYVSQGSDPVSGGWYLYDFGTPNFPDYPKYAVWPDAYYVSSNESSPAAYALDRNQMLNGNPATLQRFTATSITGFGFQALTPSDLDGATSPPAGAPNYFMRHRDDEVHNVGSNDPTQDYLEIWEFHVDFATPANSTFTKVLDIPVTEFDSDLCGLFSFFCFPQPGTGVTLDPLREVIMWRLQYRNFGNHETLVGNLVTDVDGTDHGGIRWFELRKTGAGLWSLHQEGTYAPDDAHRWMGSIAMDQDGNIALGYSVSNASTIYPSIRYAGRLADDPPSTLPQGEHTIIAGSGSQTSGTRWGDYSAMSVDPADGCTFWYTNEYMPASGNWQTRIAAFKFGTCGAGELATLEGTVTDVVSSDPITGVRVQAQGQVITHTGNTLSGPGGAYTMLLISDTYTVTASAYSYLSSEITGISVISGTTTTLDVALTPAPLYVVSGTIADAATGWPLYANIDIQPLGYPRTTIWNDPVTGHYSATLPGAITHTLTVNAWVGGYDTASRDILLMSDQTENFELNADPVTCEAPGYQVTGLTWFLDEDFENWPLPAGWNIVNNGGDCVWQAGSTDDDPNNTGGSGEYADADSDYCGAGTSMDTDLQTPILDLTGYPDPVLEFKSDMRQGATDQWDVDLSLDGGSTWPTNLLHREGQSYRGPETITVTLTGAGGQNNVRVRFRYQGAYDYWWQVDEVGVYSGTPSCDPQAGGLAIGNVYDGNTGDPLVGAEVVNEDNYMTTTQATPADDDVDDGFYTLFSPAGTKSFTATLASYGAGIQTPTVVQSDTIRQDFALPAGVLAVDSASLAANVRPGLSTTLPLMVNNLGGATFSFEFMERDGGFAPTKFRASGGPDLFGYTFADSNEPDGPVYQWVDITTTGISITLGDDDFDGPFPIGFDFNFYGTDWAEFYMGSNGFLSFGDGSTSINNQCPLPNANTPNNLIALMWDDLDPSVVNDLAYYQTFASCPYGDGACLVVQYENYHHFSSSPPGPIAGTFEAILFENGDILLQYEDAGAETGAESTTGIENGGGDDGLTYPDAASCNTVDSLADNLAVYFAFPNVPWLFQDPITGTVSAGGDVAVDVIFDASVPEVTQLGEYYATLRLFNDSPYGTVEIPVTMTVAAPEVTVTPLSLAFGAQNVGDGATVAQTVTITNDGTFSLTIASVSLTGADAAEFIIAGDSGETTLTPGGTRTVQVSFDPVSTGAKSANLTIQSDDSDESTIDVTLSGTGLGPGLQIIKTAQSPEGTLNLPLSGVVTYTIVLSNSGNAPATGVVMTDVLPLGVSFGSWIEQGSASLPAPGDTVIWGPYNIPADTAYIVRFTVNITDSLVLAGQTITNTVRFDSANAGSGSDDASFGIADAYRIFLPIIARNN